MKSFALMAVLLLLPWSARAHRPHPSAPEGVEGLLVPASRSADCEVEGKRAFNYDGARSVGDDECGYDATSTQLASRGVRRMPANDSRGFPRSQHGYDFHCGLFLSRDSVVTPSYLISPNGLGPWSYANLSPARYAPERPARED